MQRTIALFLWIALLGMPVFMNAQQTASGVKKAKVDVYYFHPNERCPIDQSIEENARKLMQSAFARELKEGTIRFQVLNTDDKANAAIASGFDINAQALYIVHVEKNKTIKNDLTEFAFANGLTNPEKFRTELRDQVENALKTASGQ
jgi:hypothetical protein